MSDHFASFWEHFQELRHTVLSCLLIVAIGTSCAFAFKKEVFSFFTDSLQTSAPFIIEEVKRERIENGGKDAAIYHLPHGSTLLSMSTGIEELTPAVYRIPPAGVITIERPCCSEKGLILLSPLEGLLLSLKVSILAGTLMTSPLWLYLLVRFFLPALYTNEKRLLFPIFTSLACSLVGGIAFAKWVTLPLANHYLTEFNQELGTNFWTLPHYVSYATALLFGNAAALQVAALLFLLVHFGYVTAGALQHKRRHAIVAAFMLGALLTPPDIFTQFLLALPLIGFYELAICYAKTR